MGGGCSASSYTERYGGVRGCQKTSNLALRDLGPAPNKFDAAGLLDITYKWTEFSRKEPTHILGKIELWVVLNSTIALLSPAKNSKFFLEPILQKLNLKFIFYIESYGRAKL